MKFLLLALILLSSCSGNERIVTDLSYLYCNCQDSEVLQITYGSFYSVIEGAVECKNGKHTMFFNSNDFVPTCKK